jgi:beta-N-acetylhexosaminidase
MGQRGTPQAVIFGCQGPVLDDAERRFFRDADPLGFILFARNCLEPDQVRGLVADLRGCLGRENAPVLIDQEGGRVARLGPPHWRQPPAPGELARLTGAVESGEAVRLNARLIAADLHDLGITVNCLPVLDVLAPGAYIAERSFGAAPDRVARLGLAAAEGLLAGGVLPVVKHLPGMGRAMADSHFGLPTVDVPLEELERMDFAPFRALSHMPWGMTAHVVYRAVDGDAPATTSGAVIGEVIRGSIGFDGLLLSDDLSMEALSGDLGERAAAALRAGCDVALHCNGVRAEMEAVAGVSGPLCAAAMARLDRGEDMRAPPEPFDKAQVLARLDSLMGSA